MCVPFYRCSVKLCSNKTNKQASMYTNAHSVCLSHTDCLRTAGRRARCRASDCCSCPGPPTRSQSRGCREWRQINGCQRRSGCWKCRRTMRLRDSCRSAAVVSQRNTILRSTTMCVQHAFGFLQIYAETNKRTRHSAERWYPYSAMETSPSVCNALRNNPQPNECVQLKPQAPGHILRLGSYQRHTKRNGDTYDSFRTVRSSRIL